MIASIASFKMLSRTLASARIPERDLNASFFSFIPSPPGVRPIDVFLWYLSFRRLWLFSIMEKEEQAAVLFRKGNISPPSFTHTSALPPR